MAIRVLNELIDYQEKQKAAAPPDDGIVQRSRSGGGDGGGGKLILVKITGHAHSVSPYIYNGQKVNYNGTGSEDEGDFDPASGADIGWKLINLSEIGPGGAGWNPLPNDSVVGCWPIGGGYFGFVGTNYRGTYS